MSRVHDPLAEVPPPMPPPPLLPPPLPVRLALPPIALSELKEPTKDFLLAKANAGATPLETMKELLDRGAERAGFRARRCAAAEASRRTEAWAAAGNFEVQSDVGAGAGAGLSMTAPAPQARSNKSHNKQEGGDER